MRAKPLNMNLKWRFGIVAAVFLAAFMLYPQMQMWQTRGAEWQGNYAYNDIDEVAYASYLRALIDGRPRKNDPYTGRDDSPSTPQPESLFSIQFAAPYAVAIPARILGIGAPWAMTLSGVFAGCLAAFSVFWVVARITGDNWWGMAGALAALAGGALAAGEGAILGILNIGQIYPYFPGFRRYIPGMAFPFFFVLAACVWKMFEASCIKRRILFCVLASFAFSFTVFSYFYIWTTAAAWLGVLFVMTLVMRGEGYSRDLKGLVALGAACLAAVAPYAYLLSLRVDTMDSVQLLVRTHAPDFARVPIYVGLAGALILVGGGFARLLSLKERTSVFALSFCLVPLVLFNQQIVTGRSLQPIHYQVFIGNYVAAVGLVCAVGIVVRKLLETKSVALRAIAASLTVSAAVWGFVECYWTIGEIDWANELRDRQMPVARRLEALAKEEADPFRKTVFNVGILVGDDLPTVAPQNTLWARHQHVFAGLTWEESKERYYQWLYYQGFQPADLDYLIKNDFVTMISLFGWGRHTSRLSSEATPLSQDEIAAEVANYARYVDNYGPAQAGNPKVAYVVIPDDMQVDLTNFDRWYERGAPEMHGGYKLYIVTPRFKP